MGAIIYVTILIMYLCFRFAWELFELMIKLTVFAVCLLFGRRVWLRL
jgi:hypothetical protein